MSLTINNYAGRPSTLSDEIFIINASNPNCSERYAKGTKVRLISGVDDSKTPGYHFAKGWVTTCRLDAEIAEFVGFKKNDLILSQ